MSLNLVMEKFKQFVLKKDELKYSDVFTENIFLKFSACHESKAKKDIGTQISVQGSRYEFSEKNSTIAYYIKVY